MGYALEGRKTELFVLDKDRYARFIFSNALKEDICNIFGKWFRIHNISDDLFEIIRYIVFMGHFPAVPFVLGCLLI